MSQSKKFVVSRCFLLLILALDSLGMQINASSYEELYEEET